MLYDFPTSSKLPIDKIFIIYLSAYRNNENTPKFNMNKNLK